MAQDPKRFSEIQDMSNYKVIHGETGFDIMKDGAVHSTGWATRWQARRDIDRAIAHERNLAEAATAIHNLRLSLRDSRITDAEISRLLLHEAARGA